MKQGFQKIMPIVRLCIVQITTLDMLEIQKSGIPPGEPRFISLPVQKAIAVPITAAEQAPQAFLLSRTTGITARGGSRALRDRGRIAANIHILHTT